MIVCICKSVSNSEINSAIDNGVKTYGKLQNVLGVGTQCGSCSCEVKQILANTKNGVTQCQQEEQMTVYGKMPLAETQTRIDKTAGLHSTS